VTRAARLPAASLAALLLPCGEVRADAPEQIGRGASAAPGRWSSSTLCRQCLPAAASLELAAGDYLLALKGPEGRSSSLTVTEE
jgi:hypothetical protein